MADVWTRSLRETSVRTLRVRKNMTATHNVRGDAQFAEGTPVPPFLTTIVIARCRGLNATFFNLLISTVIV